MEYVARLMRGYPQLSLDYIETEMPMAFGWALVNFYIENDGWLQFAGIKRIGKGFIGQEVEKLKKQYYDAKKQGKLNGG